MSALTIQRDDMGLNGDAPFPEGKGGCL